MYRIRSRGWLPVGFLALCCNAWLASAPAAAETSRREPLALTRAELADDPSLVRRMLADERPLPVPAGEAP